MVFLAYSYIYNSEQNTYFLATRVFLVFIFTFLHDLCGLCNLLINTIPMIIRHSFCKIVFFCVCKLYCVHGIFSLFIYLQF